MNVAPVKNMQINAGFILDVMKQNDTLVVKRGVCPSNYFTILLKHQTQTDCKFVRLEALGSAIPNLIKVCKLVELCEMARIRKISVKPRRMKIGCQSNDLSISMQRKEHVVCKFIECMKIDLEYTQSENEPVRSTNYNFQYGTKGNFNTESRPRQPKKPVRRYNDYSPKKEEVT